MYLPKNQSVHDYRDGGYLFQAKRHLALGNRWQAARVLYAYLENHIVSNLLDLDEWLDADADLTELTLRDVLVWLEYQGDVSPQEQRSLLRADRMLRAVLHRTETTPVDLRIMLELFTALGASEDDNLQEAQV